MDNPLIYVSNITRMTGAYNYVQLLLVEIGLTDFLHRLALNNDPLNLLPCSITDLSR
jgi:hypothetical protein